jgi:hypothetical protein
MSQIAVTALSSILPEDLTTDNSVVTFTSDGNTNQVNLFEAVNAAVNTSCNLTLDKAYDSCGAGLGREIIADAGAVEIIGGFKSHIPTLSQLQTDTNLFDLPSIFGSGVSISGTGMRKFANVDETAWMFVKVSDDSLVGGSENTAAIGFIDTDTFEENYIDARPEQIFSFTGDETSGIGWRQTLADRSFHIYRGNSGVTDHKIIEVTQDDEVIIDGSLTMPTTEGAFSPPVLTTTQRNALTPTAGMMIYNSTDSKHQGYDGTSWNNFY